MEKIIDLISRIDELLDLSYEDLQRFAELQKVNVGDILKIEGSVNTLVINEKWHLRFMTIIPPLVSFKLHWHDCIEKCTVISGQLADKKQPSKIWKKDEICTFEKGQPHVPFNPSRTEATNLIVDFYINI